MRVVSATGRFPAITLKSTRALGPSIAVISATRADDARNEDPRAKPPRIFRHRLHHITRSAIVGVFDTGDRHLRGASSPSSRRTMSQV
jgi:hypothetical protein